WIPSTSFRVVTGSFPRRRNSWSTTSPTALPAHGSLAALSPSPMSTAPSRGIFCNGRQEGYFFAERKPKNSGGPRVDRRAGTGSWTLNKKQEPVKSIVDGREMVVGRKSFLSFNDGRRKNSGWVMYEYEMCSPGFERRVLCHVKKKESSTLSAKASTPSKKPAHSLQSDVSPPPTAVVQHPISARPVTPPESRLSSVDSVAPNEAGVPSAALSSTDVGGGEPLITVEELEAFLASPSPSVDLGDEQ
ncbi:unnamed protein product, partial [Musa acuminata var. zebrina]